MGQNLRSHLAGENIKRETAVEEADEARNGIEDMGEVYHENGKKIYIESECLG